MKNPAVKLSQNDRMQLNDLLAAGPLVSPGSNEAMRRVISDSSGNSYDVGGESHGVVVNIDSVPHIISEQHAKILDCGHIVTSLSQVLGRCDFGHIICNRHELWMCAECRRIICLLEVEEKNGLLLCPKCARSNALPIVLAVIAAIIGLILVFSVVL